MIIGILGFAQTGKDTVANIITKRGAQKIGFADALKRTTMEIFDFTPEQMWGTAEQKEAPDLRYPREHTWGTKIELPLEPNGGFKCLCCGISSIRFHETKASCYLTPRYALKIIGTEGARHCYDRIWVQKAIECARYIELGSRYRQECGLETGYGQASSTAVFIDCRFANEVAGIQDAGGKVFRIKRPGYEKPMFDHPSETEQLSIPDSKLQGVIENDGTLEDLEKKVYALLEE